MDRGSAPSDVRILFEDAHWIAVVKPAGLPTANAPAGRRSLFAWLRDRLGRDAFVGIVSRLDAPVSGVVVAAKTPAAAADLAAQFRTRSVGKTYRAVVGGRFPAPLEAWTEWTDRIVRGAGPGPSTIEPAAGSLPGAAAGRQGGSGGSPPAGAGPRGSSRHEMAVQDARTAARVLRRAGEVSLVELEPLTGRRHQLRAQLAARGCPIVGDRLYGSRLPFPVRGGIALHAARLAVRDPSTGEERIFSAPAPDWERFFPALFGGRPDA